MSNDFLLNSNFCAVLLLFSTFPTTYPSTSASRMDHFHAEIADHTCPPHPAGHSDHQVHSWLGSWESTEREENWQAFVKALKVSPQYTGDYKTFHKFWREPSDSFRHEMTVPGAGIIRVVKFRLGEEVTVHWKGTMYFNHPTLRLKYTEIDGVLHAETRIPAEDPDRVAHAAYWPDGDGLVKIYQIGNVVAKKWYKRRIESYIPV